MSRRVIALARPRVHHDALDWARRVATNGGAVSQSTLRAVSAFCDAIDRAGIRDRFYRLNLFAGRSDASLNAVRTPLFRGPSLTGTQYGNATDTNNNFVQGDYAETGASGGLTGNGSTKRLNTGFAPSSVMTRGNSHLAVYVSAAPTSGTFLSPIGSFDNIAGGGASLTLYHHWDSTSSTWAYEDWRSTGSEVRAAQNNPAGFLLGISFSASDRRAFFNGVQSGATGTATFTGSMTTVETTVFARNNPTTPTIFSSGRLNGYSIGQSMTDSQAAAYYTAMQTFQTALGRQV